MADASATVEQHVDHIRRLLAPALERAATRSKVLKLVDAVGRVAAADVRSPVDLPLFRNSQMDGYAVLAEDLKPGPGNSPITLRVAGVIAARPGAPGTIAPGTCLKIMTGAAVPDGADAIVPVEDVEVHGDLVTVLRPRESGEFIRGRGSDVAVGALLVSAGTRLAPRHLAALAAAGLDRVDVRARVRVAVVTTGAELVAPGTEVGSGEVFDSNQSALVAAVIESGATVVSTARVVDDHAAFANALDAATASADIVVTSGGISQGDFEVVRDVLEPLGALVGHVAMQPGGPQATAVYCGIPVVSFPGNPVSTQVSFAVFLRPLLRAAAGLPEICAVQARASADIQSVAGKRQFLRGTLDGETVEVVGGAGSHLVARMAASNALVDIPADTTAVAAGEWVTVLPL